MRLDCHRHEPDHARLLAVLRRMDGALHRWFRRPPPRDVRRILVLRQDRLGDAAVTLPLLAALRARHPEADVDVVAQGAAADLLRAMDAADDVIPPGGSLFGYRDARGLLARVGAALRGSGALLALARRLRARRYDVVLDAVGRRRNVLLAVLAGGWRAGFDAPGGSGLLHHRVALTPDRPYAEHLLALAAPLGVPARPALPAAGTRGGVVAFHLGYGGEASKRWSTEHWARLAELVGMGPGRHLRVLVGPGEAPLADALEQAGARFERTPADTVAALVDRLRDVAVLACIDSGPMHVADWLGVPLVTLFNGSDPRLWGPLRSTSVAIRELEGGACWFRGRCTTALCVNAIPPEAVAEAMERLLASGGEA